MTTARTATARRSPRRSSPERLGLDRSSPGQIVEGRVDLAMMHEQGAQTVAPVPPDGRRPRLGPGSRGHRDRPLGAGVDRGRGGAAPDPAEVRGRGRPARTSTTSATTASATRSSRRTAGSSPATSPSGPTRTRTCSARWAPSRRGSGRPRWRRCSPSASSGSRSRRRSRSASRAASAPASRRRTSSCGSSGERQDDGGHLQGGRVRRARPSRRSRCPSDSRSAT